MIMAKKPPRFKYMYYRVPYGTKVIPKDQREYSIRKILDNKTGKTEIVSGFPVGTRQEIIDFMIKRGIPRSNYKIYEIKYNP